MPAAELMPGVPGARRCTCYWGWACGFCQEGQAQEHTLVPIIIMRTSGEKWAGMQISNEMNGAQTQRCLIQDSFLVSDRSSTLRGCGFNREYIGSLLTRPRAGWMQSFKQCHQLSLCLCPSPRRGAIVWLWAASLSGGFLQQPLAHSSLE